MRAPTAESADCCVEGWFELVLLFHYATDDVSLGGRYGESGTLHRGKNTD